MGSAEASQRLTDWFRQWRSPLRKFLLGKGALSVADLDDVSQEVFLRLLRYQRAELVEHPQAYLFKVAANVAMEWAIRAGHRYPHDPKWLAELTAEDSPEEHVAREEAQGKVERALNALSARHREVLKLQFTEGLSYSEIAGRLGTTPRSIKRSITKSYQKLRVELEAESLGVRARGRG